MKTPQIKRFKGLNNVTDQLRLAMGWLARADNVNITDTGAIERRDGYSLSVPGVIGGAYATVDGTRMYVIDNGDLKHMRGGELITIREAVGTQPMHWAEVADDVYFANGSAYGIITRAGNVRDWIWPEPGTPALHAAGGGMAAGTYQVVCTYLMPDGRETGAGTPVAITLHDGESIQMVGIPQVDGLQTQVYVAPADSEVFQLAFATSSDQGSWDAGPDHLSIELAADRAQSLPIGSTNPTLWAGQLYAMQYIPSANMTVIWISHPLGFHLFDLERGFISVPGRGTLMVGHEDGLIIGTDTHVYAYDGEKLATLAPYGAVPGWSHVHDEDTKNVLFWTTRGLCSALPFANLTLRQVSVAPGVQAGAALIRQDGAKRYVVSLIQGGSAYNPKI